MIRTRPQPACPLCATQGELILSAVPDRIYGVAGAWGVRRCGGRACGLTWLDPLPLPEDIGQAYRVYFTHQDASAPAGPAGWLRRLHAVFVGSMQRFLGLHRDAQRLADMFLDDLPPGRLLDVGCGDGRYLARMRARGWTTSGVDFDAAAVQTARERHGLDVCAGELASHQFPADSFDALTMSHVIEHVFDPVALLSEARRILKPGGRLVATTPNNQSLGFECFGACWYGLDPPRHVQVFSPTSLRLCAAKAGCEAPRVMTTAGRAETFLAGSIKLRGQALASDGRGRSDRSLVARTLKAQWLIWREQRQLKRNPERGEEAVLIYQKPATH